MTDNKLIPVEYKLRQLLPDAVLFDEESSTEILSYCVLSDNQLIEVVFSVSHEPLHLQLDSDELDTD